VAPIHIDDLEPFLHFADSFTVMQDRSNVGYLNPPRNGVAAA
jgi:hypothetical protein